MRESPASSAIPEQNKVEAYSGKAIDTAIPEHISQAQGQQWEKPLIRPSHLGVPLLRNSAKRRKEKLLIQNWTLVGKQRRPLSHSEQPERPATTTTNAATTGSSQTGKAVGTGGESSGDENLLKQPRAMPGTSKR
ncbi:hypothetical protein ACJJTC_005172 [Scirpophaga incertulas]